MYLHLGNEKIVHEKEIIGVFDIDNTTIARSTRDFLNRRERGGKIVTLSEDIPKSFVVCSGKNAETVYLSQISAGTLRKRQK